MNIHKFFKVMEYALSHTDGWVTRYAEWVNMVWNNQHPQDFLLYSLLINEPLGQSFMRFYLAQVMGYGLLLKVDLIDLEQMYYSDAGLAIAINNAWVNHVKESLTTLYGNMEIDFLPNVILRDTTPLYLVTYSSAVLLYAADEEREVPEAIKKFKVMQEKDPVIRAFSVAAVTETKMEEAVSA